jgi:hypothetical protein
MTIDAGAFVTLARPDIVVLLPEGGMADSGSCKWDPDGLFPSLKRSW